jgi:hypothetical protein
MEIVLWSIIAILTLTVGIGALAALVSMSNSKYRG